MIHETMRGLPLFGPCSLPRSLCVPSPAHSTLHGAGHALLSSCPCSPLVALLFRLCFPSCSLALYAHDAEHCAWHPHSLSSPSFVVCAPWDPPFSRLPPLVRLPYPPLVQETMQARCTHGTWHTPRPTTTDVEPPVPLVRHHAASARRCRGSRRSRCRGWPIHMPRGARPLQAPAAPQPGFHCTPRGAWSPGGIHHKKLQTSKKNRPT